MVKHILLTALIGFMLGVTAAQADELSIEGVGISRDVPCDGKDVGVYGAENTIKFTGACGRIIVHGANHIVSFEQGNELSVSGTGNKVVGGTLATLAVEVAKNEVQATIQSAASPGRIDVSGAEHQITLNLASAARLEVDGAGQRVRWSLAKNAPEPNITSSGADHVIQKQN